jgi:hypothetical protein
MCATQARRPCIRAAILCDHPVLREAIKVGLVHCCQIEVVEWPPMGLHGSRGGGEALHVCAPDFVVVACLTPAEAGPPELPQAALTGMLGGLPILVIAQQPVERAGAGARVVCLGFPFSYDELYDKATELCRTRLEAEAQLEGDLW